MRCCFPLNNFFEIIISWAQRATKSPDRISYLETSKVKYSFVSCETKLSNFCKAG